MVSASLVAQMVKNLPSMQETRVQSLVREYPLEKGMVWYNDGRRASESDGLLSIAK